MRHKQFKLNTIGRPIKLTKKNNIITRKLNIGKNQNILFEIDDEDLKIIKKKLTLSKQEELDIINTETLLRSNLLPSIIPFTYHRDQKIMYMQKYESDLNDFNGILTFKNAIVEILELLKTIKTLAHYKLLYVDIKLANIFVKEIKNGIYELYLGDIDSITSKMPYTYTICTSNAEILMMLPEQRLFALNTLYYALIVTIFNIFIYKTNFNVTNKFNEQEFFKFLTHEKNESRLYDIGDPSLFEEDMFKTNFKEIKEKHIYSYIVNLIKTYLTIPDGVLLLTEQDLINEINKIIKNLYKLYFKDK